MPYSAGMKLEVGMTDEALLELVGGRLTAMRLALNLTQEQVAEQACLGVRTVQRLESGAVVAQLSGFLRVCRVLGVLDRLDLLLPETKPGPMDMLKRRGKVRKRASGRRGYAATGDGPASVKEEWTWGEP